MQGKGAPLPLQPIPKSNHNTKTKTKNNNKIKVVYTENLTDPKPRQSPPEGYRYCASSRLYSLTAELLSKVSAVDHEFGACHETRLVGSKEKTTIRDFKR